MGPLTTVRVPSPVTPIPKCASKVLMLLLPVPLVPPVPSINMFRVVLAQIVRKELPDLQETSMVLPTRYVQTALFKTLLLMKRVLLKVVKSPLAMPNSFLPRVRYPVLGAVLMLPPVLPPLLI